MTETLPPCPTVSGRSVTGYIKDTANELKGYVVDTHSAAG